MPIYRLSGIDGSPSTELVEQKVINRILMKRYSLIEEIKQDSNQVFGIVVGTVVVNQYMQLLQKLKEVLSRANKKSYEMLIGKLNEPKLKNLSVVDMHILVSCRETSFIDSREFMTNIVTPHEVFMALLPSLFPWESKIITDWRVLLQRFSGQELTVEKIEQDLEGFSMTKE